MAAVSQARRRRRRQDVPVALVKSLEKLRKNKKGKMVPTSSYASTTPPLAWKVSPGSVA